MAILLAAAAFCATLTGGFVALRARRARYLVLGLAAGVMLGVVAMDLMPEALELAGHRVFGVPVAMLTASAGFLTIHVLERSLAIHRGHEGAFESHRHSLQSVGMLAGLGLVVHSVLDGIGIGLAFQANAAIGVTVAIAVVSHDFADGFNTFTITTLYGNARRRALTLLLLDAVAPVVGAVLASLISVPQGAIGGYLGYFAGFLLYLATSDILPEAHANHPSRLTLLCTVGGVAFMWVVVGLSQ
ncbi:MAG TPA: ZIP family metal transporter [Stackebrandtia sp.]|jgi:ZIP family zinc transporter|uniref:ZIP family metal transporter n=1 Tax=Stackebrandtia sp. TaxID=2023065 RepID=UPI002D220C2E|nr:ZIP family metal transporter [Stackebrandtia sp.]HZE39683.1 ZIP family metal transporter [Stackebrandtia sp.]